MYHQFTWTAVVAVGLFSSFAWPQQQCKCGPSDDCWPTSSQWTAFNSSLDGKLILDTPPAISCYPGPDFNAQTCAIVSDGLTNQSYVADNPIALSYPTDSCPPVDLAANPCALGYSSNSRACDNNSTVKPQGTCSIGDQPRYTVNATEIADVASALIFAKRRNIRLVVRNTGHDILRRSTGYGSLQIWIRYLRKGITFQERYGPSRQCQNAVWTGPAFVIRGGYTWLDLYGEAAKHNVVVVGGGTPSVGCLGGWMQGGGHSPATHDFGLGADQVLEAEVVLSSGQRVTASPCENSDLLFAIRGGGPATYGVVVSTVIKAHPNNQVAAQILSFAPLSFNNTPAFMDAVATIYENYPYLSDAGFSGYGSWSIYSPTRLVANYSTGFIHTIANFGSTAAEAEAKFSPVAQKLAKYNGTSLYMTVEYLHFSDFNSYYYTLSDVVTPVGQSNGALCSRLLDRKALAGDVTALKKMLQTTAGTPDQATSNNIIFVGGGQVFKDASDPYSGVNPAWRKTYVHNIVARGWAPGSDDATIKAVHDDLTYNKALAMKQLAPDSGSYMNEGDRFDPDYLQDFYGEHQWPLSQIKQKYDPDSVFYCPTCIGSEYWTENAEGVLCRYTTEESQHKSGRGGRWSGGR